MKKIIRLLVVVAFVTTMVSCDFLSGFTTRTKSECLTTFLNSAIADSFTTMYLQIDPDNSLRTTYKNGETFELLFGDLTSYGSFSTDGNEIEVALQILGSPVTDVFTFNEESEDYWSILSFTHGGSAPY